MFIYLFGLMETLVVATLGGFVLYFRKDRLAVAYCVLGAAVGYTIAVATVGLFLEFSEQYAFYSATAGVLMGVPLANWRLRQISTAI